MNGQILEAFPLRNRMYLYGDVETWMMEFIGGDVMFRFDRQFDQGIINTNCVAEVGGIHYVFGENDIWMHDGTSDKPLATGKVRKFIYREHVRPDEASPVLRDRQPTHQRDHLLLCRRPTATPSSLPLRARV
jgi:hypothetical protein